MHNTKKPDKPEKNHKHEPALLLLCFITTALIGYFLTHHVALLNA